MKKKKNKFTEIYKLKDMLEKAYIPFEFTDGWPFMDDPELVKTAKEKFPDLLDHYQICYPSFEDRYMSVIQGFGTYGSDEDKLEIMVDGDVEGYLTAENVFARIKKHCKGVRIMKKVTKVNPETFEIEVVYEEELEESKAEDVADLYRQILPCSTDEFGEKYMAYKNAQKEWEEVYEAFKEQVLTLHEERPDVPKTVVVGGVKMTYVSASTRTSIDSKKLKEEEPEIAKKFTKTSNVSATLRIDK